MFGDHAKRFCPPSTLVDRKEQQTPAVVAFPTCCRLAAALSAAPLALLDGHRRRDDVGSGAYEDDPARAQAVDGRFGGGR